MQTLVNDVVVNPMHCVDLKSRDSIPMNRKSGMDLLDLIQRHNNRNDLPSVSMPVRFGAKSHQ